MTLQDVLLSAHEENDRDALAKLYEQAADASDDINEQAFFLTQALVFALETGADRQEAIRTRLQSLGRL